MSERKSSTDISLVLGSGGARGLAHIGVIRWLEEHNYRIRSVSGCSIGALIGGVYAAGKLDELEKWMCSLTKTDILTLLDFAWESSGFFKGEKVINALKELVGEAIIEELPVSFTAVASDIVGEKEVWINEGSLFDAIRASISLPLFFTPFDYHGVKLIDGGVLNPVPIAPVFSDKGDLIIAVNLGGKMAEEKKERKITEDKSDVSFQDKIKKFIQSLQETVTDFTESESWGMYDIADQAFDAMQGTIARQKIAAYPPDHLIEIPRNACGTLEFDRAAEMIELGYRYAARSFENIM